MDNPTNPIKAYKFCNIPMSYMDTVITCDNDLDIRMDKDGYTIYLSIYTNNNPTDPALDVSLLIQKDGKKHLSTSGTIREMRNELYKLFNIEVKPDECDD